MSLRVCGFISLIILGLPAWSAFSSAPGIDNFRAVDQNVYCGAQPTEEGFRYLAKLGIKIVLDLREHPDGSDDDDPNAAPSGGESAPKRRTGLPEIRLRLHGEDSDQAVATNREEHGGS